METNYIREINSQLLREQCQIMEDCGYSPVAIDSFKSRLARLTSFEQHNILCCVSITDPKPALDVFHATVS